MAKLLLTLSILHLMKRVFRLFLEKPIAEFDEISFIPNKSEVTLLTNPSKCNRKITAYPPPLFIPRQL